jgi:TfoX/Sxy family transcriptional regulator of competence genes
VLKIKVGMKWFLYLKNNQPVLKNIQIKKQISDLERLISKLLRQSIAA